MISVVIPTLNDAAELEHTLGALVPAAVDGLVREVIIADGGSADRTLALADDAGAVIVKTARGRGMQLAAGADIAKSSWLLFLHPDTLLENSWDDETARFMRSVERGERPDAAAAFRFALRERGLGPRALERMVELRSTWARLPSGNQGLLISRKLYNLVGGYAPLPAMEDADLARRLGRDRVIIMGSRALTGPGPSKGEGYVRRTLRSQQCLAMYLAGVAPDRIARLEGSA